MYRIIGGRIDELERLLESCEDPIIVDIRREPDYQLRRLFKGDYKWIKELTNRGITKVILYASSSGRMRARAITRKAKMFKREVLVLYDDELHYKEAIRIIENGRSHRTSS